MYPYPVSSSVPGQQGKYRGAKGEPGVSQCGIASLARAALMGGEQAKAWAELPSLVAGPKGKIGMGGASLEPLPGQQMLIHWSDGMSGERWQQRPSCGAGGEGPSSWG